MKKSILAAIAAAALLLTGCTINPLELVQKPSSSSTTAAAPLPEPGNSGSVESSPQSVFAQSFSGDYYSRFGSYPSDKMIASAESFGIKACRALESGTMTWSEVTKVVLEGGKNLRGQAAEIYVFSLGYSIGFHCPSQVPA